MGQKERNKRYYDKRIKPFRKKKQPIGYHSFVCPICCKRSFMKNLKYTQSFSVDYVLFTGRAGIQWFKGQFAQEQKEFIIKLIKIKLISAMKEFGITAEDLGLRSGGLSNRSYVREISDINFQSAPRVSSLPRVSSSINKRIAGGIRYG